MCRDTRCLSKVLRAYSILPDIKTEFANYRFRQTPSVSTVSPKCSKLKYYAHASACQANILSSKAGWARFILDKLINNTLQMFWLCRFNFCKLRVTSSSQQLAKIKSALTSSSAKCHLFPRRV